MESVPTAFLTFFWKGDREEENVHCLTENCVHMQLIHCMLLTQIRDMFLFKLSAVVKGFVHELTNALPASVKLLRHVRIRTIAVF